MSDVPEVVKTGGVLGTILSGVVFILWAVGHFLQPKREVIEARQRREDFYGELRTNPGFRAYAAEIRDDKILTELKTLNDSMKSIERVLLNTRDIAADTARANNIVVHYDNG